MATKRPKITEERYTEAAENYEGWCNTCEDFTEYEVEPDAHEYNCGECGEDTVYGAEEALLQGLFVFKESDSET